MEKRFIEHFNTLAPNGYNLNTGGLSGFGVSEPTRERLKAINKGNVPSTSTREKISSALKGRKLSPETRQRMKAAAAKRAQRG